MKALEASPKTLKSIFASNYFIPDFQRPYSWDIEECDQLWEDLNDYFEGIQSKNAEEKYFLGTIVIFEKEQSDIDYYVIDGQQRLTTIQLLIKALYDKSTTSHALKSCLQQKDPTTDDYLEKLRLNSEVISNDFQSFEKIILNKGINSPSKRFLTNFNFFKEKLEEFWLRSNSNPATMEAFVTMMLNKIVLLPIKCSSQDDALTLFDTINNRGLPLSDADILKAKLHKASGVDKNEFVKSWSQLKRHDWLFRVYMHILRAKAGDVDKEKAMRSFFMERQDILQAWKSVMTNLKKSNDVDENNEIPKKIMMRWELLKSYPNYYWMFPVHVYLNKHAIYDETTESLKLEDDRLEEFDNLLVEVSKYIAVKGLVYNSVNRIKDDVYQLCVLLENQGDFASFLKSKFQNDLPTFESKLLVGEFGRYSRILILLAACLNERQDPTEFHSLLTGKFHIEHILPKQWNHYDSWTEETYERLINSLGNLAPFEENLNISAKNEFFKRKQDRYQKSKSQDLKDLTVGHAQWYPEQVLARKSIIEKRLLDFVKS